MELIRVTADTAAAWQAVEAAALAGFVALPADPLSELLARLTEDGTERHEFWLGRHGGVDVATGQITTPLRDNLDEATVRVTVEPAARRRGFGAEVTTAMVHRCRALGRTRLIAEVPGRSDGTAMPAQVLAAGAGFAPKLSAVRRVLDTDTLDDALLAVLEKEARLRADGYAVRTWVDRAPADAVDGLAAMAGRMSTDAPMGDLEHEPEVWDAARWRAKEELTARAGVLRLGTMVCRGKEIVAFTDLGVSRNAPTVGYQWDTIVRTDHRGHRLGQLAKITNLRQLRDRSPGTRYVNTWNAASNTFMISINESIGWRAVDTWTECQLDL